MFAGTLHQIIEYQTARIGCAYSLLHAELLCTSSLYGCILLFGSPALALQHPSRKSLFQSHPSLQVLVSLRRRESVSRTLTKCHLLAQLGLDLLPFFVVAFYRRGVDR